MNFRIVRTKMLQLPAGITENNANSTADAKVMMAVSFEKRNNLSINNIF
jgi:hypothetical protein